MLTTEQKKILQDIKVELSQIYQSGFSLRQKFLELKRLLERSAKEITEDETLQFPSLFSRIVFIAQKYKLSHQLEHSLHQVRIVGNFLQRKDNNVVSESQYKYAHQTLSLFFDYLLEGKIEKVKILEDIAEEQNLSLAKIRVQVIDIDKEDRIAVCRPKDTTEHVISVRFGIEKVNSVFNDTFDNIWLGAQLNLLDCKIDKEGFYIPSIVVLEPDYLIDASAMAECFQSYGNSHLHYFRRKFETVRSSHYLLLGNLANFFLDELIYADNPRTLSFEDTFLKSFKEIPFEYTVCKDIQEDISFRDFMSKARLHFENIRRVVTEDMPANGFLPDRCVLEPSFFSETFGFQGRLDMLQLDSDDGFARIIELKSGKTPYPQEDVTKIAPNHETQASVYRMMIQSVFQKKARDIYAMILYSSANFKGQNLRLSAPYKQFEKEILNERNLIVATEHELYTGNSETVERVFRDLFNLDNYEGRIPDFFSTRLTEIKKVLSTCSDLERLYFYRFISFVSRELYLQKMGDEGYDTLMSTSALWDTSFQERKDALELISDLEIESIEENARDMQIRFKRQLSSDFVNFREGEICIIYPRQSDRDTILTNQILKGTVIAVSAEVVLVRFRYKQKNKAYFEQNRYWVIEHDKLDHSYNGMYQSLFSFLQAPQNKKDLLLGLSEPRTSYKLDEKQKLSKDEKQEQVINKALAAEDYFLIVGPPGTGKTSIFARQLIEKFYEQKETNILVLAYTNRAVDELCDAVCNAFGESDKECEHYIRIGSEYSCAEPYRHRLLQNVADRARNRRELLNTMKGTRIYVGTLASILGKQELFEFKKFEVAIIDEASQILEPQIIGLLPLFDKFIMIGDHKQLSTITLQSELKSLVDNKKLNEIDLYDCRESIFERLFRVVSKKKWSHAFDTLDYHGRMHEEIACLVNEPFYEGKLSVATDRQLDKLSFSLTETASSIKSIIANKRVHFFDVQDSDELLLSNKTNRAEAEKVVELAIGILQLYRVNDKVFDGNTTLGIIAPYRNQIALIRHLLEKTGVPELRSIMVDTVERYQGSQRDIIIVSFSFNQSYQMRYFANMNRERTVDRKLNVALTRAREQLFLVGNGELLKQNKLYRDILSQI